MVDPAAIGAAAGAFLMSVGAFLRVFKIEKSNKQAIFEILEALKILKNILQNDDKIRIEKRSDMIPGFAPECLQRAKEYSERFARAETEINSIEVRFEELHQQIENIRHDMKTEFANLRKEIRENSIRK